MTNWLKHKLYLYYTDYGLNICFFGIKTRVLRMSVILIRFLARKKKTADFDFSNVSSVLFSPGAGLGGRGNTDIRF